MRNGIKNHRAGSLCLAATAALCIASSATAADGDEFRNLDRNRDNFISRDELGDQDSMKGSFGRLDTNRDERLSGDEFTAALREQSAGGDTALPASSPMFGDVDSNGDGYISATELDAAPGNSSRRLNELDRNGDGRVSNDEFGPGASSAPAGPGKGITPPAGTAPGTMPMPAPRTPVTGSEAPGSPPSQRIPAPSAPMPNRN